MLLMMVMLIASGLLSLNDPLQPSYRVNLYFSCYNLQLSLK